MLASLPKGMLHCRRFGFVFAIWDEPNGGPFRESSATTGEEGQEGMNVG
jgi:hypothetical protein